jgi:hypothetical protein
MSNASYAVQTPTCTYLLDENGICRSVRASPGATVVQCIGAQFVACLDLDVDGGLVGELRLGASALFVRHERERFALLRTLPIVGVQLVSSNDDDTLVLPAEQQQLPAYELSDEATDPLGDGSQELDLEDLLSISVTEVTLMLPLYRLPPKTPGHRG